VSAGLGRFATTAIGLSLWLSVAPGNGTAQAQAQPKAQAPVDTGSMQGGAAPPDARDPHAYSDGVDFTRGTARPKLTDQERFRSIRLDHLEVLRTDGETIVPYDLEGWFGQTYNRVVLKAEGEFESGDLADARTELLWNRAIAPYWDTQVGMRYDSGAGPNRTWVAAGIEGLAPYWFNLELTAYVGESSRSAFRIDASYDMLISQKLILQPRFEANFYGKDDLERGLGSGLSDMSLALRLRYEIRRELAPYLGIERVSQHGGTEGLTRAAGGDPSDTRLTLGLRFWF
jgi:copper resistance protein B